VYFVADGVGLASLDARTGEVNWLRREFGAPWAPMVFDEEGRLVIGWPKRTVCFAENGAEVWSLDGTAKHLLSAPGRLVVGRFKSIEALDPSTRKPRWEVDLGSRIAGLALGDDGLLVASLDSGELAALDLDGRLRWRKKLSEKRLGRPATVEGGETLVMDLAGELRLVGRGGEVLESIETGASFWRWRPTVGGDGRVYVNHQHEVICIGGAERAAAPRLVATEIVVAADDFVVDVWVNGKLVPMERRRMLAEVFGATTEKISVELRDGDWIVFNVVANRLRWGGASYFGAYGIGPDGGRAFVSQTEDGWYACDRPSKVGGFIRGRDAGTDRPAVRIENPWSGGAGQFVGRIPEKKFPGQPIWGTSANTWLKYVVRARSAPSPSSCEGAANSRPSEE
jgi:hypothetical protein